MVSSEEYIQKAFEQAKEMMPLSLEHLKTINSLSPEEYAEVNRLVEKEPLYALIQEENAKTRLIHPPSVTNKESQKAMLEPEFENMFAGVADNIKKQLLGMNPFSDKERMRKIGLEILTDPVLKDFNFSHDPVATMKIIATKTFISTFRDEEIVSKIIESVLQTDVVRKAMMEENRKESFKNLE